MHAHLSPVSSSSDSADSTAPADSAGTDRPG